LKTLKKEVEILSQIKHANIINLIDFNEAADYVKKNGSNYKAVAITMELAPGGELFEFVADSGKFSEETARTYFKIIIESTPFSLYNPLPFSLSFGILPRQRHCS